MMRSVSQVDVVKFLSSCRSLFEELRLRCGGVASQPLVLEHFGGLRYEVSPLNIFSTYDADKHPSLAVVLYESKNVVEKGEGTAHIGLISPVPTLKGYNLETLEYCSMIYVRLSAILKADTSVELRADSFRHRWLGTSLISGREFRDVICFLEDAMSDKVGKFLPPIPFKV